MDYSQLSAVYDQLGATSKRLEKTHIVSQLLKVTKDEELEAVLLLLQGRTFARWDKRTLGVSSKIALKAIAQVTGSSEKDIQNLWKKEGDLGKVATLLLSKGRQVTLFSQTLEVKKVFATLRQLPEVEGMGSVEKKTKLISSLLSSAEPSGVRYLLGTILEELRVGVAEGVLRDALCWAYLNPPIENGTIIEEKRQEYNALIEVVQAAYDRSSDYEVVAKAAKKGVQELKKITFVLGTPVRVMLAQREASIHDAMQKVGKPAVVEFKYDGFRIQCHKKGNVVHLYTRRLEEVTTQFPDVVEAVKKHIQANNVLLDAEAVGFDVETGKYTAFQHISQRIRRKYDIEEVSKKLPVELCIFDILLLEDEEILTKPLHERRAYLQKVLPKNIPKAIRLSEYIETDDEDKAEKFYKASLAAGNEGVMVKAREGIYQPGSRVGHMIKLKPTLDTMDLVIVGAEWGEGKRSGWFTSFTLACKDSSGEEFLPIGKVGTGFKELESEEEGAITFAKLTELLQGDILEENGREVQVHPRVIIEIKFEEVQKSPTYGSGYALRFPRAVQLREDRGTEDMTTLDEVDAAFGVQRGR